MGVSSQEVVVLVLFCCFFIRYLWNLFGVPHFPHPGGGVLWSRLVGPLNSSTDFLCDSLSRLCLSSRSVTVSLRLYCPCSIWDYHLNFPYL